MNAPNRRHVALGRAHSVSHFIGGYNNDNCHREAGHHFGGARIASANAIPRHQRCHDGGV